MYICDKANKNDIEIGLNMEPVKYIITDINVFVGNDRN